MKESDSHFVVPTSSLASHFFVFAWPLVTYLFDHLHYLKLCIAKANNEETKCQPVLLFFVSGHLLSTYISHPCYRKVS